MDRLKTHLNHEGYSLIPIIIIGFAALIYIQSAYYWDTDNAYMLATGREIAENGILYTNPFESIPGFKIIVQNWLLCLVHHLLHSAAGDLGLWVLMLAETVTLMILSYKVALCRTDNKVVALFMSLLFVFTGYEFLSLRATTLTLCLLMAQVLICEKDRHKWIIPLLVIIEANIHASFLIFHFVYLLPYIVPSVFKGMTDNSSTKKNLLLVPFMILAALINPYTYKGALYIFYSYNSKLGNIGIQELMPMNVGANVGYYVSTIIIVLGCAGTFFLIKKKETLYSSDFYAFAGSLAMFFISGQRRLYILLLFGSFLLMTTMIKRINFSKIKKFDFKQYKLLFLMSVIFAVGAVSIATIDCSKTDKVMEDSQDNPIKAVKYLDEHAEKDAKVYTSFAMGNYVRYHGYKTMTDARPELLFESIAGEKAKGVFKDWDTLRKSTNMNKIDKTIKKYDFDYYCMGFQSPFYMYVQDHYKLLVKTDEYALFTNK